MPPHLSGLFAPGLLKSSVAGSKTGSVVPTGLGFSFSLAFPTLKRGANNHCAYGAGSLRQRSSCAKMQPVRVSLRQNAVPCVCQNATRCNQIQFPVSTKKRPPQPAAFLMPASRGAILLRAPSARRPCQSWNARSARHQDLRGLRAGEPSGWPAGPRASCRLKPAW